MPLANSVKARQFAHEIVARLRQAGFEALWAGGCVRDQLMGCAPKDYDVATSARPEQIREIFGTKRTLAIGASFGVIVVLGPREAGQIDVATFRKDASYSDSRRPDSVTFCDAEQDALRRDFTINGLFYDPIEKRIIDYVGGQHDLEKGVVRAIGNPDERFTEDRLRVLRAVRFAATLSFEIESETFAALRKLAPAIHAVSAERITDELRKTFIPFDPPPIDSVALGETVHAVRSIRRADAGVRRRCGLELLRTGHLLFEILPEAKTVFPPEDSIDDEAWNRTLSIAEHLETKSYGATVAVLLRELFLTRQMDADSIIRLCRNWRMSNDESQIVLHCLDQESTIRRASQVHWPELQRQLIDPRASTVLEYAEAVARVLDDSLAEIEFCKQRMQWPPEQLNPEPLINGDDLRRHGIPQGPIYRQLLHAVREAQLLGQFTTREEALEWARLQWAAQESR